MATGTSFVPDKRLRRAEARRVPFAAGGDPWPMNPPCSWTESKLSSSSASTQKSSPSSPHNGDAPAFLTSCSSPLITQVFIYSRPGGVQFLEDSCAYHAMNPLVRCRNRRARSFSIGTTMGNLTAVRVNDWKMVFLEQRSKGLPCGGNHFRQRRTSRPPGVWTHPEGLPRASGAARSL